MAETDPYRHHPELRGRIRPAAESFFRDLDIDMLDISMAEAGMPADWRTPDDVREANRRTWLQDRMASDLWIFGYGSLMWDPSVEFTEVRQARATGFQRSFCLWDEGGRATADNPGLMLALDEGGFCDGLAFRIDAAQVDHETFVLFRREMIAPAYRPAWLALDTPAGPVEALGFVADRGMDNIRPGIPLDTQARMIASAQGVLGTNFDYLADTHAHLQLLGIEDAYISSVVAATRALRDTMA